MDNLAVANVLHRKTRAFLTAAGVALGVILIVLTQGLVHGFLLDQGRRNSAVTAEIMVHPKGSNFGLDFSLSLGLPIKMADELGRMPGVAAAVPIARYDKGGRVIDGIDFQSFARVSEVQVTRGRAPASGDEAMVDQVLEHSRKLKLGDPIDIFGRPFTVVGIYSPESLGRIKVPIPAVQNFFNQPGRCSMILVKVQNPAEQQQIAARIRDAYPDCSLFYTRDLPVLYSAGTPALQTFLNVVVSLAVVVSFLVILLAMYTTVTERTRQIGILKSLGASKIWIAGQVEKEALLITLIGVAGGMALSLLGKYAIQGLTSLTIELEFTWLAYALGIGLLSGAIGALYPALRAAAQDPIKALSYE